MGQERKDHQGNSKLSKKIIHHLLVEDDNWKRQMNFHGEKKVPEFWGHKALSGFATCLISEDRAPVPLNVTVDLVL